VRIFAWKLALDGLATQCNRKQRRLTDDATCRICGTEEENSHHAVVRCTKASALRKELCNYLSLSEEKGFDYTGLDWLLLLLSSVSPQVKANILLLLWRAWFLRNDATHDKGEASVKVSALFIVSYSDSLRQASPRTESRIDGKGKQKMYTEEGHRNVRSPGSPWQPPERGWVKVSTDAGFFYSRLGRASIGVEARDAEGKVLLQAWQVLSMSASPEEAEAEACLRGVKIVVEWIRRQPTVIESDCLTLIQAITSTKESRAAGWNKRGLLPTSAMQGATCEERS
jgi:hypothetical protein